MNEPYDILCLSHLRWNFVFQRPQHLLSRFRRGRVYFFEEPLEGEVGLQFCRAEGNVTVVTPTLPPGLSEGQRNSALAGLLEQLVTSLNLDCYVSWYYTPMALDFSQALEPVLSVYDCMDQLSHFKGADPRMSAQEKRLFEKVDLVFTGGLSLFEDKRGHHPNVYPFPSSVDVGHFGQARKAQTDPTDQASIPGPRVGYFGVLDERLYLEMLAQLAKLRQDLHFVMVGPICKIDATDLPQGPNLHYLGPKSYQELPAYLAGWDVAMMPFALNDATRFISPTKTPEYLAGGKPVVSTSIQDVIRPYQALGLVEIADTAEEWSRAIDRALARDAAEHLARADQFLAKNSWDATWARMQELVEANLAFLQQYERIVHV